MATGAVASPTLTLAVATETSSGVAATAPTLGIVLASDTRPENSKPTGQRSTYGNPDPVMAWRKEETTSISLPMLPVIEDNGLGELLLWHFGADNTAQLASSDAYKHEFTRGTIKTGTIWIHDGLQDQKIRMCGIDSVDLTVQKSDGDVQIVCSAKGADMQNASDFGSPTYMDVGVAMPHQLSGFQTRLEWGQPTAAMRDTWKSIKWSSKRSLAFGVPGKAGLHVAGSSSPTLVTSSKTDTTIDIDFIDTDQEELARFREGVDTDPTATRHVDNFGLVDYRFTVFGDIIGSAADPWGEADVNNVGSTTATISGTYSGAATALMVWEVKLASSTVDTYSYRNTSGGVWSAWSTPEPINVGSLKLALDGGTAQTVSIDTTGLVAGATIASALQTAIQALGGDFAAMTVGFADSNYTITHASKQPSVTAATRNDISAALKLGVANGGTEAGNTSVSLGGVTTMAAHVNDLSDGVTIKFSSSTAGASGDLYYVSSHRRRYLRVLSTNNVFDSYKESGDKDFKTAQISAYHTSGSGATKPLLTLCNAKTTAYA